MERRNFLKALLGSACAIPLAGKAMAAAQEPMIAGESFAAGGYYTCGEALKPKAYQTGKLFIGGYDPTNLDKWQNISLIEDLGNFGTEAIEANLTPVEDVSTPEIRAVGSMWLRIQEPMSEADLVDRINQNRDIQPVMMDVAPTEMDHGQET